MHYKIEEGIEIPKCKGLDALSQYPWRDLKIDQSFLIRCEENRIGDLMRTMTSSRAYAQRKTGCKFALRRTADGIRVWRVK